MKINSTRKCLKKLIILGQIFGYFPILKNLTWKSLKMYYALFTITGSIFLCTMQVIKILNTKKIDLDQIDYVLKYLSSAYVAVIFVRLAKRWPKLMHDWNNVEIWMRSYGFPMKLNKRIMWLIGIFTIGFLVESLLHQASRIYRAWQCHEDDAEKAIKFFFGNLSLSHVFQHINYNIPSSVILQFWIFQTEFGFMYTDLFVMVISACLHSRIKQITERINLADKKQTVHEKIWENLRRDYTKLSVLVQRVNEEISNIILVSFVPNVFTILTQVFATLKPKHNRLEAVYFYFSMIFLISRTVMVCICGSLVNEESRKPLHILNCVSHTVYNDAIEKFINQLLSHELSLNGKHLFTIKKSTILDIAGAIVTYELVLIEFNQYYLNSWSKSTRCD